MTSTLPLIIVVAAALIGAALMAYSLRRNARYGTIGAGLGAVGGAAGALAVMLPLNFCTFEAERETIDAVFGIGLIAVGMAVVLWPLRWFLMRRMDNLALFAADAQPGAFKSTWLAALFLAPTIIILALFLYYPALENFRLSVLL